MNVLPINPGFEVDQPPQPAPPPTRDVASEMLMIALKALSQRFVVALSSLFGLALAGSVFALYWKVLPNPSIETLVGLGLYAWFVLVLIYLRYRK